MLAALVRGMGARFVTVLMALVLQVMVLPLRADELSEFRAALDDAQTRYRVAMTTLETRGREETAAEVRRFRQTWQAVIDWFDARRPASLGDQKDYAGLFMQVDARILGALIVIDIGSRDAARDALAPIAETLADLNELAGAAASSGR
jgi:hypothetical protein